MDKPISEGDLVVVAYPTPCCGSTYGMGWIFRAGPKGTSYSCVKCGASLAELTFDGAPNGLMTRASRLKRIPPFDELEGEKTQEDIREPA